MDSSNLPMIVLVAALIGVGVVTSLMLVGVKFGKKQRGRDIQVAQAMLTADNHMDHARNWLTKPSAKAEEARLALEDLHDIVRQGIDDPRVWTYKRTIEAFIAECKGVPVEEVTEEWRLPTGKKAASAAGDEPWPPPRRRERRERHVLEGRILVVDPEKAERLQVAKLLKECFPTFEVTTAADEDDVYAIVRNERIDLVLTEMHMPRVDGRTILAYLKRMHPTVEVIVMSAVARFHAKELADLRAYGFLDKPIIKTILEQTVRHCAEQRFPYNEWRKAPAQAAG